MMDATVSNLSELDLGDHPRPPSSGPKSDQSRRNSRGGLSKIPRPVNFSSSARGSLTSSDADLPPRSLSPPGSSDYRDGSDSSSFTTENGVTVRKPIKSKINSFANVNYTPGGGTVQVFNEKKDFSDVQSRCRSKENMKHKAGGGNIQVFDEKIKFKESAQSKVGSFQNSKHVPGGGDKKIENHDVQWEAKSKVGSWKNASHKPGGGNVQIDNRSVNWEVDSRVGSWKNVKHKPGGGNVQIESRNLSWDTSSRVGSWKNFKHKPGGGNVQIVDEQLEWDVQARTQHVFKPKNRPYYQPCVEKSEGPDAPLETDLDAVPESVSP